VVSFPSSPTDNCQARAEAEVASLCSPSVKRCQHVSVWSVPALLLIRASHSIAMITLMDPPEDEVLYSVLYSAPSATSLQAMVSSNSENTTNESTEIHPYAYPRQSNDIDGNAETDANDDGEGTDLNLPDYESCEEDSLRQEMLAMEDSCRRNGFEHIFQFAEEYERIDGIPTFTMPVKLDMSWDESDFLEEMAEDMKALDDVAGKILGAVTVADDKHVDDVDELADSRSSVIKPDSAVKHDCICFSDEIEPDRKPIPELNLFGQTSLVDELLAAKAVASRKRSLEPLES
jgi:hypothetical protein